MYVEESVKTKLIDGKLISSDIRLEITKDVSKLKNEYNIAPKLCVILIGDDPASHVYVRNKQKSAISAGMYAEDYKFSENDNTETVITLINKLNAGWFKNVLESFAAVKGSKVHQSFTDGYLQYISAICVNKK